ncbi:MAG TPA: PRC and DUF2382 domain-containing protein [Thermoleophilaceae bacterium]|nr:PRC and DUF2382 domain-containing protein [Thermoleophilaceae bacterium]
MTTNMTEAYDWQGRTLKDRNGNKIGKIDSLYFDRESDRPEWALVHTGLFGTKSSFVPISGASPQGEDVVVQVDAQQVKDAPKMDPDQELSEQEEAELFRHYGVEYTTEGSVTATGNGETASAGAGRGPVGEDVSGPTTDEAMTRSEEELRVGTAQRERGRARLRKYVVTEQVQQTVPVQREEVRVEREPITDANVDRALDGPEISEEEHEVVLHAEEPVVEKRAVPRERVRMDKETHTDEAEISEEVRKEQIEAEGDTGPAR